MNIDPEKVKELVLIFAKLNDNYQNELMKKAYELKFMQGQFNLIKDEGLIFKNEMELNREVSRRSNKRVEEVIELMQKLENVSDTDKAALFMLINQLSGKGNAVQESDITITINQREVSMRDYLEKYLVDADYDKAQEKVSEFMFDVEKEKF